MTLLLALSCLVKQPLGPVFLLSTTFSSVLSISHCSYCVRQRIRGGRRRWFFTEEIRYCCGTYRLIKGCLLLDIAKRGSWLRLHLKHISTAFLSCYICTLLILPNKLAINLNSIKTIWSYFRQFPQYFRFTWYSLQVKYTKYIYSFSYYFECGYTMLFSRI